jgi:hypothetical protein
MASSPPRWIFQPLYTTIHHFYCFFLDKLKKSFIFLKDFFALIIRLGPLALTNKRRAQDVVVVFQNAPIYTGRQPFNGRKNFLIFFENRPRRREVLEFGAHFRGLTKK